MNDKSIIDKEINDLIYFVNKADIASNKIEKNISREIFNIKEKIFNSIREEFKAQNTWKDFNIFIIKYEESLNALIKCFKINAKKWASRSSYSSYLLILIDHIKAFQKSKNGFFKI